jgi:glycosyltransferase involved in cell wall biosynthesis
VDAGAVPTAVSRAAARQVDGVLGGRRPVAVLPNGIDPDAWRAPGPPPADGPLRVVTAIRFARRKRPLAALTTARRVRELLPGTDVRVEVAGDGPLLAPLRRTAERDASGEWLTLPGRLTRAELAERYHRAHLYLSPARLESFGIAALEARTAGLPVAGLAGAGLAEFVTDGVTGLLARDDDDLVHRVAALLADRPALGAMAEHNRTVLPDQVWPEVVRRTRALYEQARSERAATARD